MAKAAILQNCKNILTISWHYFWSSLSPSMHIHNYKNISLLGDKISVLRLIYNVEIYSLSNKWHCVCTDDIHSQGTDTHTPSLHHSQHEIIRQISKIYLKVISISETISKEWGNTAIINKDSHTNQHLSNTWIRKLTYQPNKGTFTSYEGSSKSFRTFIFSRETVRVGVVVIGRVWECHVTSQSGKPADLAV